jgi:hypothetical protein
VGEAQTYEVVTGRDGDLWWIKIPGVEGGYSQTRRLTDVEMMARDVISMLLDVPEDSFEVKLRVEGAEGDVRNDVFAARERAYEARTRAEDRTRAAVRELMEFGLEVREIATLLRVPPAWVNVFQSGQEPPDGPDPDAE